MQTATPSLTVSLGKHVILECYDCDLETLCNAELLEAIFLESAEKSGATIMGSSFKKFDPQGISGVVIIAESHFTVHTWPEYRYAAIDMFTCGSRINFETAKDVFRRRLKCRKMVVAGELDRGIVVDDQLTHAQPMEFFKSRATQSWKTKFQNESAWGLLTSIDVHHCDPALIRDGEAIKRFTVELCDLIGMKRYGDPVVVDFGEDERVAGFSMTQLIETSLISGHFANQSNNAYVDIFSCKYYEPAEAANFCVTFFKGSNYTMNVTMRK
ncbi:MAG TPA: adenosylmethionine decarboxylase [Planctomycetota bacterium]|nr:adenosylmethionine decarboxylase [Planctomycetota bacterium]